MDDVQAQLKRLERKMRTLLAVVAILAVTIAAQVLGWMPSIRTSEVRTEKIVLAEGDGGHRSIEISARGIRLADTRESSEMWLIAPSNEEPCIQITSPSGSVLIGPASLGIASQGGGLIQAFAAGARAHITMLGGKSEGGQVDLGPGFAAVKGEAGSVVIDGRRGSVGLRVVDEKGNVTSPR